MINTQLNHGPRTGDHRSQEDRPPVTLDEVIAVHNAPHPQASLDGLDLIAFDAGEGE